MVSHSVLAFCLQINERTYLFYTRFYFDWYKALKNSYINIKNQGFQASLIVRNPDYFKCFP